MIYNFNEKEIFSLPLLQIIKIIPKQIQIQLKKPAIEWDYGILPPSSIKGLPTDKNVQGSRRDHLTKGAISFSFHVTDFINHVSVYFNISRNSREHANLK
jgi:hypothetical protein